MGRGKRASALPQRAAGGKRYKWGGVDKNLNLACCEMELIQKGLDKWYH
jgi:hypothetical protein